jgi:hypothetical protein
MNRARAPRQPRRRQPVVHHDGVPIVPADGQAPGTPATIKSSQGLGF